jgi:hypothetical protein
MTSQVCNVTRAKRVVVGLAALFVIINFHFFWTAGLSKIHPQPTPPSPPPQPALLSPALASSQNHHPISDGHHQHHSLRSVSGIPLFVGLEEEEEEEDWFGFGYYFTPTDTEAY